MKAILGWIDAHDDFEARAVGDEERRQFDRHYFLLNEAGKRDYEQAAQAAKADILDARGDWLRWRRDAPGDVKRPMFAHAPRAAFSRSTFKNKDGSIGLPALQPPRHVSHTQLTVGRLLPPDCCAPHAVVAQALLNVSMFLELHTTKWHQEYLSRHPQPPPTGAVAEFQLQPADKFAETAMELLCQHLADTMM